MSKTAGPDNNGKHPTKKKGWGRQRGETGVGTQKLYDEYSINA